MKKNNMKNIYLLFSFIILGMFCTACSNEMKSKTSTTTETKQEFQIAKDYKQTKQILEMNTIQEISAETASRQKFVIKVNQQKINQIIELLNSVKLTKINHVNKDERYGNIVFFVKGVTSSNQEKVVDFMVGNNERVTVDIQEQTYEITSMKLNQLLKQLIRFGGKNPKDVKDIKDIELERQDGKKINLSQSQVKRIKKALLDAKEEEQQDFSCPFETTGVIKTKEGASYRIRIATDDCGIIGFDDVYYRTEKLEI